MTSVKQHGSEQKRSRPSSARANRNLWNRLLRLRFRRSGQRAEAHSQSTTANRLPAPLPKRFRISTCVPQVAILTEPPENHSFVFGQAIRESAQLLQCPVTPEIPKIDNAAGDYKRQREARRGEDVDCHAHTSNEFSEAQCPLPRSRAADNSATASDPHLIDPVTIGLPHRNAPRHNALAPRRQPR